MIGLTIDDGDDMFTWIFSRRARAIVRRQREHERRKWERFYGARENTIRSDYHKDKDHAMRQMKAAYEESVNKLRQHHRHVLTRFRDDSRAELAEKEKEIERLKKIIDYNREAYELYREDAHELKSIIDDIEAGARQYQLRASEVMKYYARLKDRAESMIFRVIKKDGTIRKLLQGESGK